MIIYSIIILISSLLLLLPVHSFYIMNAAVVEECSTKPIIYLNKFDSTKMRCSNQIWRYVFIFLEYSCFQNKLTRLWTIQTNTNKGSNWPQEIFVSTGNDYTRFNKTSLKDDPTIEENSNSFDSNNNQLTTYMWTSLTNGPQCRIKYTILKDICAVNKGAIGAKLTDFVCYYGKQVFSLIKTTEREALNKLLDNSIKGGSTSIQNNSFPNKNTSNLQINFNPSALNTDKKSFWQKNKLYIIIVGIIVAVIIIVIIVIINCRRQSSNKNFEKRMSNESTVE